ncbi:MAG: glycine betaine ABC transporter substrate-binding protein [Velocimicrobium sp.]
MKKIFKKSLVALLTISMFAFALTGCGNDSKSSKSSDDAKTAENETVTKDKGTIKLVYVNWAEGIAMTNLAKVILEEKMGYDVEMTMADVAPIFTSLADNDQDVFMDAWLPITHKSYMDKYGDNLDDLGNNFEGAKIGLVVPDYMDINSISELNDIADDLDGEIIGIDSGAGIMQSAESAIDVYGLNLELLPGSGPAMTAALGSAIEDKEPIVVTGWAPHWKFAKWNLKFLDDPEGAFGDAENIHTITRKGFSDDMPTAAAFFTNFFMDSQQLGDLMGAISDSDEDPASVAKAWMEENEALVQSWIPAE